MNKKRLTGFSILLVSVGILIGAILTSGLNFTGQLNADPNSPPQFEEGVNEQSYDSNETGGQNTLMMLSDAFADVAERVNPAVVTISTEQKVRTTQSPYWFPFEDFFGQRMPDREFTRQGLGSGVIVGEDGIVITNNHVVQNADDIIVRLFDDKEYKAEIRGVDSRTDLAVLKIDATNLPALKLGNSDNLRVGEWVLAIGSPLQAEFAHTVTAGIVSAKGRRLSGIDNPIQDFIQTDAAINPGNSGGALVNLKGELVGINTAIASRTGGNIGIGFAIPTNLASKVMKDILEKGKVVRGWLGVSISDIPEEVVKMYELKADDGAFVREVINDGPADKSGVEAGDIILEISGKKLRNSTELVTIIGGSEPGKTVALKILRDGKEKTIEVKLEEYPEDEALMARSQKSSLESWGIEVETASRNLREKYNISGDEQGVIITSVQRGSISERLGLQEGDMIIRINRQYVSNVSEFSQKVGELESGDPVVLYIRRGDRKFVRDFILP